MTDTTHTLITQPAGPRLLLTPVEAAAALGLGRSTVYVLMGTGELRSVHVRGSRRILLADLERFTRNLAETAITTRA